MRAERARCDCDRDERMPEYDGAAAFSDALFVIISGKAFDSI